MRKQNSQEITDSTDYLARAASPMDCTGLIPSAPQNDYELDSYEDVYPFLTPCAEKRRDAGSSPGENSAE